jgi:hypothetical protein
LEWVWAGVGLLLAVPLTASIKLVADCHPALLAISNLLAETPRPVPRWAQVGKQWLRERFRFCVIAFTCGTSGNEIVIPVRLDNSIFLLLSEQHSFRGTITQVLQRTASPRATVDTVVSV